MSKTITFKKPEEGTFRAWTPYHRLPFEQYFIDTSCGYGGQKDKIRNHVKWKKVDFDKGRHDVHYCVMFDEERNTIQCYFKETTGIKQWISNFTFPAHYYDEFQYEGRDVRLKAARGWSKMYNTIKHYVREDFYNIWKDHQDAHVEIIGWSLGSATASLCCQDLFFNYEVRSHLFTFGSVRPWYKCIFGSKNMKWYLSQCYIEAYNIGDINDIVHALVPLPGYFKMKPVTVKQHRFCLFKFLFKAKKYHTEYWKSELYKNIK